MGLLASTLSLATGLFSGGGKITTWLLVGLAVLAGLFFGLWRYEVVSHRADVAVMEHTIGNQEAAIDDLEGSVERAFRAIEAKDVQLAGAEASCREHILGLQRDMEIFMNATEVPAEPGKVVDDATGAAVLRELDALLPR